MKTTVPVAFLVAGLAAGAGCSADTSPGGTDAAANPFLGDYACTVTITFMGAGMTRILPINLDTDTVTAGAGNEVTLQERADGGARCPLRLAVSGTTAQLVAGQACSPSAGVTITLTGGMFVVRGATLTGTVTGDVSGMMTGTATIAEACTRQ